MGRGAGLEQALQASRQQRGVTTFSSALAEAPSAPNRNAGGSSKRRTSSNRSTYKKLTPEEAKAKSREKVEQTLEQLENMVEQMNPWDYEDLLRKMSQGNLWRYSANNLMLIQIQKPEATRCASYRDWQKQGRQVKKGVRGAVILRPLTTWHTLTDPDTGRPKLDDKGKPIKAQRIIRGQYGTGTVFDITDTEIKDQAKAEAANNEHERSAERCVADMAAVAEKRGVRVFRGGADDPDFPYGWLLNAQLLSNPNAGGYYLRAELPDGNGEKKELEVIVTRKGLTAKEEARVMSHELGHAMLHRVTPDEMDKHTIEVEAEAVGYALASDYDVESDASPAYVMNWAKSKKDPAKELKASSERIRKAVKEALEARDSSNGGRS